MAQGQVRITATDVRYRYGRTRALNGLSLDMGGGVFGLLGPNGAGKTTLLRLAAGILPPRSGRLDVAGHDMRRGSARRAVRRLVGYLPERSALYPRITVREYLDYAALLSGITNARQRRERAEHVMERLALVMKARVKIGELSTGEHQRVAIAHALVGEPRLLVLDEPTLGMDPLHRHRVRALITDLARTTTVVLSTHVLGDVWRVCDRVAVLRAGTTAFLGSPWQLASVAPHGHELEAGYAAVVSGSLGTGS